jgi:peptidoglycan LD-endopeptidase LytH
MSPTGVASAASTPTSPISSTSPALSVPTDMATRGQAGRADTPPAVQAQLSTIAATVILAPAVTTSPRGLPTNRPVTAPSPTRIAPKATSQTSSGLLYVFPVQPISSTTYGPYHHDYPATDIFCPVGSRFVAPTSGVVDYVSIVDRWDPATDIPAVRGGLSVAIIGDDGVRYYGSHLSRVLDGIVLGVRVTEGQLLGLTGKSGDARFTDPHLHFGISPPTTSEDWQVRRGMISPYKYLLAWATGTQLRPVLK